MTGCTRPKGESLEQIVLYYLGLRQATLAVAESCTGGLVAQRITSVAGSSRSFLGGAVVYSNELKTAFADVPAQLIEQYGAVSPEVASALAEGIRKRTGATLGLGITGIAGPGGATESKPVGLRLCRRQRRPEDRLLRTQLPRRPQPRPRMGQPAGAGSRPTQANVDAHRGLGDKYGARCPTHSKHFVEWVGKQEPNQPIPN